MQGINFLKILFITLILAIGLCFTVEALTLEEAISLAKKAYPPLKEKIHLYEQNRFLYKASFDPYFPTLSSDLSYQRTFESSVNSIGRLWDNQCTLGLTLNYRLFDGGYRYSIKEQTLHTFDQAQTDIKIIENDLNYMVKEAFYTALVKEKILQIPPTITFHLRSGKKALWYWIFSTYEVEKQRISTYEVEKQRKSLCNG